MKVVVLKIIRAFKLNMIEEKKSLLLKLVTYARVQVRGKRINLIYIQDTGNNC